MGGRPPALTRRTTGHRHCSQRDGRRPGDQQEGQLGPPAVQRPPRRDPRRPQVVEEVSLLDSQQSKSPRGRERVLLTEGRAGTEPTRRLPTCRRRTATAPTCAKPPLPVSAPSANPRGRRRSFQRRSRVVPRRRRLPRRTREAAESWPLCRVYSQESALEWLACLQAPDDGLLLSGIRSHGTSIERLGAPLAWPSSCYRDVRPPRAMRRVQLTCGTKRPALPSGQAVDYYYCLGGFVHDARPRRTAPTQRGSCQQTSGLPAEYGALCGYLKPGRGTRPAVANASQTLFSVQQTLDAERASEIKPRFRPSRLAAGQAGGRALCGRPGGQMEICRGAGRTRHVTQSSCRFDEVTITSAKIRSGYIPRYKS